MPGLRIVATSDGAIVSSVTGCFRIRRQPFTVASLDWVPELCQQLAIEGIVEATAGRQARETDEPDVFVVRQTPLGIRVSNELAHLGIEVTATPGHRTLTLIDHSGLGSDASRRLVRGLQHTGCASMSVWANGVEMLYGPIAVPLRTACWNCCQQRFSDSLRVEDHATIEDSETTARTIAENLGLAVRYPHLTAYGCVMVDNGETSVLHSVVPLPWCDVCGGAAALDDPLVTTLARSPVIPEELRILADPRGGVVRQVVILEGDQADAPRLPICCSAGIAPAHNERRTLRATRGEGKAATREGAVRGAIGEGIERYAASVWDPSALTRAPFNAVRDDAFDPRWLVLYDDAQYARSDFPFAPFDPELPMYWTSGQWLDTGENVHVPALATFMHFPVRASEQFGQITSNGLAVGPTFEDAALRALYELIERDAFMLFWLARRPAVRLAEDGCDPLTLQAIREVERLGAQVELYLLDAGTGYPTVVCLGQGNGDSWPGVTVGLATHASIDVALHRAVLEHGHCGSYIRRLMREGRHHAVSVPEDVVTGLDHALYYVRPHAATALDAFRSSAAAPTQLSDLRSRYRQDATLAACVARLRDAGIRTAAANVTSPDVALAPLCVVRAFGTYLQPIHFGQANRRLKNPRLECWLVDAAEEQPHPIA